MKSKALFQIAVALTLVAGLSAHAQGKMLNPYSARHHQSNELPYDSYPQKAGNNIKQSESDGAVIAARLRDEGKGGQVKAVPLVDAAHLRQAGLQPAQSTTQEERIPGKSHGEGDSKKPQWTGYPGHARVIAHNKFPNSPQHATIHESLADSHRTGVNGIDAGSPSHTPSMIEAWLRGEEQETMSKAVLNGSHHGLYQQAGSAHADIAGVATNAATCDAAAQFPDYLSNDEAQQSCFIGGNHGGSSVAPSPGRSPRIKQMDSIKVEHVPIFLA